MKELNCFAGTAEDLIGEKAWGMFSGVFGKSQNINKVLEQLLKQDDEKLGFAKLLQTENDNLSYSELMKMWREQQKLFLDELNNVEKLKKKQ